jgi:hypothetical protein
MNRVSLAVQDYLVLRDNANVFLRDDVQAEDKAREASRVAELDAFRACPFQQGFASEGMLCNEPPIPLRVLDFLEAQDLINLSLVCKSMHQAAHVLFKQEVWPSQVAFQVRGSIWQRQLAGLNLMRKVIRSYMQGFPCRWGVGHVGDGPWQTYWGFHKAPYFMRLFDGEGVSSAC